MVSLINFKIVQDELEFQDSAAAAASIRPDNRETAPDAALQQHTSVEVRACRVMIGDVVASEQQQQQVAINDRINSDNYMYNLISQQQQQQRDGRANKSLVIMRQKHARESHGKTGEGASGNLQQQQSEQGNFTVTWRKLRYVIEPKWHEKLMNQVATLRARATSRTSSSSSSKKAKEQQESGKNKKHRHDIEENNDKQSSIGCDIGEQQLASSYAGKVVLDNLDGAFKSGELTAILGPSGAGKTTLLDCLTGHKRSGLSGSVRISGCEHEKGAGPDAREKNLRVSIIPQNDHLMGHLTVYETLNYASKMKNCFEKTTFNHKSNITRIAQQLGLMSCLGTRINKLSGGQYKRVSIAQELLSSPDVLILDEPTSGLDAMSCYQTVQVLRKLTQAPINNSSTQMAVILTIHQPNSDVFQQFNHVYVVAQGGKCIFEGPPSEIEACINKIGVQLPTQNYNPATLIVEVAACKFGIGAIEKLNDIQRRQYKSGQPDGRGARHSSTSRACKQKSSTDEQTSTGDSAVECPSSTSSLSFGTNNNSDEDEEGELTVGDEDDDDGDGDEDKDDNNNQRSRSQVNRAFTMEPSAADVVVLNLPSSGDQASGQRRVRPQNRLEKSKRRGKKSTISSSNNNNQDNHNNDNPSQHHYTIQASDDHVGIINRHRRLHGVEKTRSYTGGQSRDCDTINSQNDGQKRDRGERQAPACNANNDGDGDDPAGKEKRLKLNSLKASQNFPFWRHTYLHFHRSWVSIVRDPMLCGMQLTLHILVPLMVSLVYGSKVGKPNACPRAGPVDIMAYALEPSDSAFQLQEDLRTTLENIGYIFFKLYGIIFAAMTVTVLTFPLDMHVLVKEFRNGWYGLSSYFIGRTLADVPFQLTLPFLAMSLSYYATGQPYSYMQWRFLSITGILILSSLIAQSQGLLFGAILMDRMKAAVFVAPAATTPIILFAGFLVRTQSIPAYLRPLSNISYLRYAIEACLISRYGFNQCECDPAVFNQTVPELPPIARSMLDYWLTSFRPPQEEPQSQLVNATTALESLATTTVAPSATGQATPDLFGKLMDSLARANSFGRNITSCEQVVPYPMIDYNLKDSQLFYCFAILTTMLVVTRLLTFFIVSFKVKRKV